MSLTYPEAIQFLFGLQSFGAQLGLENARRLAELCGNPHTNLHFIHVAGTNGKGSTCAMLDAIYRAAGRKVGLFTSPHLVSFRERLQVNRQLIAEADVVHLVEEFRAMLEPLPTEGHPTFFEVVTVMAMRYFATQRCDLVIWETGLGGRLDATNIVTPLASVITTLDLDHQQWLGHTLAHIAAEKAGIIKPQVPAVVALPAPEALEVIQKKATQQNAPLTLVAPGDEHFATVGRIRLNLLGEHQQLNAAVAVATVRQLSTRLPVSNDAITKGLETVHWPGRLQRVRRTPATEILLDGAHNPSGARTLRAALEKYFPRQPRTLVLGLLADKDWREICHILAPGCERIIATRLDSNRTADPKAIADWCAQVQPSAVVLECDSLPAALQLSQHDALTVLTGSLHFVGQAMELLNVSSAGDTLNERALNEWTASTVPGLPR